MIEQVHALARCGDCHQAYRLPRPGATYSCRACGGLVRAGAPPAARAGPGLEGLTACGACQAFNAAGARFCAECGALLRHKHPAAAPGAAEPGRSHMEASRALRGAYKGIDGVTWLYRFGALAYAVATVFAVLALARTDVPLRPGLLVVSLTTLMSAVLLMAAIHVPFQPFGWTLGVAALATVVSAVHLLGPNPFGLALLGSAAWAVVAWAVLGPSLRYRRLIAEHTDTYILHHASKHTRRSLRGRFPKQRHERLLAAMRRAARRARWISVAAASAFCLASVLGTWAVVSQLRPPAFSTARQAFEQAWNEQGLAAAAGFFHPGVRVPEGTRLAGLIEGHGWRDGLPRLEGGGAREDGRQATSEHDLGGLRLSASWALEGQTWSVVRIELPAPPLEPTLERFLQAWRDSNAHALAAFFSPGNQGKMLASIETAARNRGWERFPPVQATRVADAAEGRAAVTVDLERGRVETEWILRADGKWGLRGLRFFH